MIELSEELLCSVTTCAPVPKRVPAVLYLTRRLRLRGLSGHTVAGTYCGSWPESLLHHAEGPVTWR